MIPGCSVLRLTAVMAGVACASMAQEGGGALTLSPTSLTFNATAGGGAPPSQTLSVRASSRTQFTASTSIQGGGSNWLSISPSGTLQTNQSLRVSVNPAGRAAGTYSGTISLRTSRGTQTVGVRLVVARASTGVTLSPTSLAFNATVGGAAPASQTLSVTATSATNFTVSASVQSGGSNWLSISPSGALTTNRTITVSVNPAGLAAASYSGTISVVSGGVTRTAAVTLVVSPAGGALTLTPSSLTFNGTLNGAAPAPQTLSVTAASATNFTASASVQSGSSNWLSITPSGALTTNRTLTVSVSLSGLAAGSYTGSISIVANGSTRSVPVTFVVSTAGTGGGTAFKLIGWNDLGMHCDDGRDYSIFGVLPPYNTIHAHLIDGTGTLVVSPGGIHRDLPGDNRPAHEHHQYHHSAEDQLLAVRSGAGLWHAHERHGGERLRHAGRGQHAARHDLQRHRQHLAGDSHSHVEPGGRGQRPVSGELLSDDASGGEEPGWSGAGDDGYRAADFR